MAGKPQSTVRRRRGAEREYRRSTDRPSPAPRVCTGPGSLIMRTLVRPAREATGLMGQQPPFGLKTAAKAGQGTSRRRSPDGRAP